MLLLMHIPQNVNASGDLCQKLLKHLFLQETAPLHHHPGPLQPNGGLGWSGRHRAPETTKREEDEGLEIAGWVLRWLCMAMEGWEDPPPLWACSMHAHGEAQMWGCWQGHAGKQLSAAGSFR